MDLLFDFLTFAGIPIAIALFLFLVKKIKIAYWLAIISPFLPIGYINRYFIELPAIANWIPFIILIGCVTAVCFRLIFGKKISLPSRLVIFFLLLVAYGGISLIYNKASLFPAIFSGIGITAYISFVVIFNNKEYHLDTASIFRILIKAGIIQSIVALFQRFIFVSLLGLGSSDRVTGLFAVDGQFTFYQLFCIIIVLVYWFYDVSLLKKLSNFQLLLIFLLSIAVSGNSASLIFLPVIFLTIFFFVSKRRFLAKFRSALIAGVLIIISLGIFASFWNKDYAKNKANPKDLLSLFTSKDYFSDYLFGVDYEEGSQFSKSGTLKKGSALVFSYTLISASTGQYWFGKGPGATSDTELPGAEGYINKKYQGIKVARTSYSQIIAELGLAGLIFTVAFLWMVYRWKSSPREPLQFSLIRKTTIVLIFLYFAYENLFDDLGAALVMASLTIISPKFIPKE